MTTQQTINALEQDLNSLESLRSSSLLAEYNDCSIADEEANEVHKQVDDLDDDIENTKEEIKALERELQGD